MCKTYYNEHDKHAAAWLRELIACEAIADGDVDERSVVDVVPTDLVGYTQCHFFAGIGVWSYSLRCAGWADDRPIWTGSCPCQPFSAAGSQNGIADERHLWPAWYWLIQQCRPPTVLGEQVASKAALGWLDAVFADLERAGYACGASDLSAAGVGAPHIRQRLYFVAHANDARPQGRNGEVVQPGLAQRTAGANSSSDYWADCDWLPCRDGRWRPTGRGMHPLVGRVADADGQRRQQVRRSTSSDEAADGRAGWDRGQSHGDHVPAGDCEGNMADPDCPRQYEHCERDGTAKQAREQASCGHDVGGCDKGQGPSQSGLAPLADGPAANLVSDGDPGAPLDPNATDEARVMRLRGYGNAIVAPLAQAFVEVVMEVLPWHATDSMR